MPQPGGRPGDMVLDCSGGSTGSEPIRSAQGRRRESTDEDKGLDCRQGW
ncbi:hypothetical protein M6B38_192105 [Iris pallida]|uniref:Uncharacterized protein n=1 Tax=Iris pallida TaxID=29817 RepID=A0AAX6EEX2_IRIPA|nr:hypothetical protein M6B38_192105 [Iris pallida]